LAAIFCHEEDRVLSQDWILRFKRKYYQLERQSGYAPSAARVQVRQYLDGELRLNYRGQDVAWMASPYDADFSGASFSCAPSFENEKSLRH